MRKSSPCGTSPAVIVEFCGIPGAGKSFLAHQLVAVLASAGHRADLPLSTVSTDLHQARRGLRKLRIASLELLRDPVESARIVCAIARSGQPLPDLLHRTQNWLVVRALLRRSRNRSGFHVFDQGIVQELCSIGYRGRWSDCLEQTAPGSSDLAPDLIIRVTTPERTAKRRLADRPHAQSRVEAVHGVAQERLLHRQSLQLDDIERAWMDRFGVRRGSRRVEIENADPDSTEVLARLMDELI